MTWKRIPTSPSDFFIALSIMGCTITQSSFISATSNDPSELTPSEIFPLAFPSILTLFINILYNNGAFYILKSLYTINFTL